MVFWMKQMGRSGSGGMHTARVLGALFVGIMAVMCVYYLAQNYSRFKTDANVVHETMETWLRRQLFSEITGIGIRDFLRNLTTKPHVAGTEANKRVADYIAATWKQQGLANVHLVPYNVLLSYPDYTRPNTFQVLHATDPKRCFNSTGVSPVVLPEEQGDPGAGVRWNAYAVNGTVYARVVYCNFGSPEDFDHLENELNISLTGAIALIRYGKLFRGDKVLQAALRGVAGVILYSDPSEYAPTGVDYPHSVYMPSFGSQRGTLKRTMGDPLTPNEPAKNWTYPSRTIEEAQARHLLPTIPVLPTSAADAYRILRCLGGETVPFTWHGGINVTYKVGGTEDCKVNMSVHGNWTRRNIYNVIGYIPGALHPDQYVILGNHFDAWVYGSIDPNSGTATMLEMTRALQTVIERNETGWRPGRTLVFCAWDAEEYGLIGSREWVEEYLPILAHRAVVYLNVDNINGNETLAVKASPSVYEVSTESAKQVPDPFVPHRSVYDTWLNATPGNTSWRPDYPKIRLIEGGSDHAGFMFYVGVPSADYRYTNSSHVGPYPLYHSMYETHTLNEQLVDRLNLSATVAVGRYWTEVARRFADYTLLPLNITDYALVLQQYSSELSDSVQITMESADRIKCRPYLNNLLYLTERLTQDAHQFYAHVLSTDHPTVYEWANRRLMVFERCFINHNLQHKPSKHVIFGVSETNQYSGKAMPFLIDDITRYEQATTAADKQKYLKNLLVGISQVLAAVNCARSLLTAFM